MRRAPESPFSLEDQPLPFTLGEFWAWAASDLVTNTTRGLLAEYLVARALGSADDIRKEWDACDVRTGRLKVEVKSSAYLQSWNQPRPSTLSFDIAPKRGWDAATNAYSSEICRTADVYVFCVLAHRERSTLDPVRLEQWEFYVLPSRVLNTMLPTQRCARLSVLIKLGARKTDWQGLAEEIEKAGGEG